MLRQPEEDGLPEGSGTVNEPPPETTETADTAAEAAEAPTGEAAPRMVRRPPTPPRPRRKLPKPQAEAGFFVTLWGDCSLICGKCLDNYDVKRQNMKRNCGEAWVWYGLYFFSMLSMCKVVDLPQL